MAPPIFQNPGPVHPSACRLQLSRLQRRQSLPQPRPGCRSRAGGTPPACRDRWPRKRADKLPEARQRSQRHEAPVVCRRARAAGPAPGAEKPPPLAPGALRRNPHAAAGTAEERSPTISALPAAEPAGSSNKDRLEEVQRWSQGSSRLQIRTRRRGIGPRGLSHLHPS